MKKKHNSHYIFGLLGILVFIFFLVIGTQYFQSEYIIDETEAFETTQSYTDGKIIANPFINDIDGSKESTIPTKKFGSDIFEFSFPSEYVIRIINATTIDVLPQGILSPLDCSSFEDDKDQVLCNRLHRSPDMRIMLAPSHEEDLPDGDENTTQIRIAGELWKKIVHQDELEGTVRYQRTLADSSILSVSYHYADTDIGPSFDKLQQIYGDQYLLSAAQQHQLALDILKSLVVK